MCAPPLRGDPSAAIQVPNQLSVIFVDPAAEFGKDVIVLVEANPGIHRDNADTVSVEVEDKRASGDFGLMEEALEAVHQVGKR